MHILNMHNNTTTIHFMAVSLVTKGIDHIEYAVILNDLVMITLYTEFDNCMGKYKVTLPDNNHIIIILMINSLNFVDNAVAIKTGSFN